MAGEKIEVWSMDHHEYCWTRRHHASLKKILEGNPRAISDRLSYISDPDWKSIVRGVGKNGGLELSELGEISSRGAWKPRVEAIRVRGGNVFFFLWDGIYVYDVETGEAQKLAYWNEFKQCGVSYKNCLVRPLELDRS